MVLQLSQPGTFTDPLTEVLRNGARALLAQAVEAEVSSLLSCHADKLTDDGRRRLVRHGRLPEREIMTGIGPVTVRCPRVRDRGGAACERIRFSSAILPPYARRSKSLEVLIPILYLKGVSTGDFEEALIALRTVRSKGCLSNKTALAMIFKLAEAAKKSWRRLNGHNQLPKIILGIKFTDGIEVVRSQPQTAAA